MKAAIVGESPAMIGQKRSDGTKTPSRGGLGRVLAVALVVTLTPLLDAGGAHATAAVVDPSPMTCVTEGIIVAAPDAYSTTQNLYWIAEVHAWNGETTDVVGYGDWQKKINTGSLTTIWANTRTGVQTTDDVITYTPGFWYAILVWVYSNGKWYNYWAQDSSGGYWC